MIQGQDRGLHACLARRWCEFKRRLRQWLLEDQASAGLGGPPNNWRGTGYILEEEARKTDKWETDKWGTVTSTHEICARFNNDAHEVWIGERWIEDGRKTENWKFFCKARTFRRIALWYLWRWVWGEWFGLRRTLFYWDLGRRVARWKIADKND